MTHHTTNLFSSISERWRGLRAPAVLLLAVLAGGVLVGRVEALIAVEDQAVAVDICKQDLAERLSTPAKEISVVKTTPVVWPDAALGMPQPDMMYAQVLTRGWLIELKTREISYLYTASNNAFRYGGPTALWEGSMLFLQPAQDDPNLNGDLYQCSLVGTNPVRILAGVSEYYPQHNGVVLAVRRTSRSSHELLYAKAGDPEQTSTLQAAFAFGEAALNEAQDTWAAFVRPRVGGAWTVMVTRLAGGARPQTLPLPDGFRPERIAWEGEQVLILGRGGDKTVSYATTPGAEAPEWKAMHPENFPGMPPFMLNKSETLDVTQVTKDDTPVVEVARVWFTGDRKVVATISDLALRGYDYLGGYVFIRGERDATPVAYIVSLATGEVINSLSRGGRDMKPFLFAPLSSPYRMLERAAVDL